MLQDGTLSLPSGETFPVVGQVTGHALNARIALAPGLSLVVVGVGERQVTACQGAIDGLVTGPQVGDLGDWHGAGTGSAAQGGQGGGQAGGATAGGANSAAQGQRNPSGNRADRAERDRSGGNRGGNAGGAPSGGSSGASGGAQNSSGSSAESGSSANAPSCPPGETFCDLEGGYCADLQTNDLNCGTCGNNCSADTPVCFNGLCFVPGDVPGQQGQDGCDEGLILCNGICVDPLTDSNNCGACGIGCINVACSNGFCGDPCPTNSISCNGVCVEPLTDPLNCGDCGVACAAGQSCLLGVCCPSGTVICDSNTLVCVDTLTDPANCGLCGVVCEEGTACQGGTCTVLGGGGCKEGSNLTFCNGACVDLLTDPRNCGACGGTCVEGATCQLGQCVPGGGGGCLEGSGLTFCGEVFGCVDLLTDPANCGACGVSCGADPCVGGVCTPAQPAAVDCAAQGLTDCGGFCVNLTTDPLNCGACGTVCDTGVCTGGAC
jgi:hypothetical protein